jgi:hypothetical protein
MGAALIYSDRRTDITNVTDAIRNCANAPKKGKTRRHVKVPRVSRRRNTRSALLLMVLVPFRAIPVGVYTESGFSATAENTARTDFIDGS